MSKVQGKQVCEQEEVYSLHISDIQIVPEVFQIREKERLDMVERYKCGYQNREPIPPVLVADIKGVLYLIDGFHRIKALQWLHKFSVDAYIVSAKNQQEAIWLAVQENKKNGLPLTKKELTKMFDFYIQAKQYKGENGCCKSSRAIAKDLGFWSHVKVLSELKRRYPKVHQKLMQDNAITNDGYAQILLSRVPGQEWMKEKPKTLTQQAMDDLLKVYEQIAALGKCGRKQLKKCCEKLIERLEEENIDNEFEPPCVSNYFHDEENNDESDY